MTINTTALSHMPEFDALCEDAKTRVREVNPEEVRGLRTEGRVCMLIDVRDRDEFERYSIEGSLFLSKGWIEAKIYNVAPDKGVEIILYCGGGNRSVLAADNLQRMGYTNVLSMAGGIKAWVDQGYPVSGQ